MSLITYKKKRSFNETAEPQGGRSNEKELRFVIQKHDASHLHYDFRLEMDGVLKSWAVPKGPSTHPEDKRLALMVEDHPYDYRDFEGIIPKGQYGGGTVMIWDEGTYEPIEKYNNIKLQQKHLLKQLKAGSLKFILHGEKVKGEYALVKTNWKGENSWLLIKHNDKYASHANILKKDKSIRSKKTMAQIEKTNISLHQTRKEENSKDIVKKVEKKLTGKGTEKKVAEENVLKAAKKIPFYQTVKPMLATLVNEPIDNDDWLYEIKWDGYRAVALMNNKKKLLKSRNNKSFREKFYPIFNALKEWNSNAIVDGEIVAIDKNGLANFSALQNWKSEVDGNLIYYVFDILWYNGYNLKELTLINRRAILAKIIPETPFIKLSKNFDVSGTEFLMAAKKMGLEGIMAKRKDSVYEADRRTPNWLKIKLSKRQEVVIGGYTKNEETSKPFSALLVGVFENGKFIYTGKIGTGFSLKMQREMLLLFKPLVVDKHPFNEEPNLNKVNKFRPNQPHAKVTWLKPKLICEVSYTEITTDGVMRHPSFQGLRIDKNVKKVVFEKEMEVKQMIDNKNINLMKRSKQKKLLNETDETQVKKVNGHELKFTNLNKIYWPIEKITKRTLINYYDRVSPYILPYLKNRPQSLNRYPNGIDRQSFYQKDVTGKVPDWMDTYLYRTEDSHEDKHFLLGNNKETLLYMASLGCIEINAWNSTIKKPDYPTWCIIDLDPDKNSFNQVIEAANVTKQILDDMEVESYCKTSGSTGLHIYIPLGAKYTYEQSKEFAKIIVTLVHRELPKFTSLERTIKDRKGRMYLDFLQNRASATIAAPYSVRPKPGATVSMPLMWDEVKKGLKMKDFTIFNALERLDQTGDLFKPVLGKGIDLKKIIRRINSRQ